MLMNMANSTVNNMNVFVGAQNRPSGTEAYIYTIRDFPTRLYITLDATNNVYLSSDLRSSWFFTPNGRFTNIFNEAFSRYLTVNMGMVTSSTQPDPTFRFIASGSNYYYITTQNNNYLRVSQNMNGYILTTTPTMISADLFSIDTNIIVPPPV